MNMTAALFGYGGFVLSMLAIGAAGYWKADELEVWTRRKFKNKQPG